MQSKLTQFVCANKHVRKIGIAICMIFSVYSLRNAYDRIVRKINSYPPGPFGLPWLGNLLSFRDIVNYQSYLASNYGGISMIYIGQKQVVFLHTISSITQVFNNSKCNFRNIAQHLVPGISKHMKPYEYPMGFSEPGIWEKRRKLFQSTIVSSLHLNYINNSINYSINNFIVPSIDNCIENDILWHPQKGSEYITINTIWNALFGTTISVDSKQYKQLQHLIENLLKHSAISVLLHSLKLNYILPNKWLINTLNSFPKLLQFISETLLNTLQLDENVFDMNNRAWNKYFLEDKHLQHNISAAFKLMKAHRKIPAIYSTKNGIIGDIFQALLATTETTSDTIESGLILLTKYPEIQNQIYEELHDIFQSKNKYEMKNIKLNSFINKTNYLRAFVHELVRIRLAIGVPHCNLNENVWIYVDNKKYCIPKNSVIIADINSANTRDKYWIKKSNNNANNICIDLWLNKQGQFKKNLNPNKMLGFGIGARECVGKTSALRILYLVLAKLILLYQFKQNQQDVTSNITQQVYFLQVKKK
eukprot:365452_1